MALLYNKMQLFARSFIEKLPGYRLSKGFFYILMVLLPIQTGKAYFSRESFYFGYHSFYNTFFLYLTDILIFGLIVAWLCEILLFSRETATKQGNITHRIYTSFKQDRIYQILGVFWLISAISLIFSRPPAGEAGEISLNLYGLAKISEFILLFVYVKQNVNLSRERFRIFWLILATIFSQAVIGIAQYLSQNSLGLKLLGEEFLRPGLKGVAEFVSHGIANPRLYDIFPYLRPISDLTINIRAYGTLPHPNVLAGLLFLGLIINIYLLYGNISPASPAGRRERFVKKLVLSVFWVTITTGLVVTFSRLAWVISFLAILLFAFMITKFRAKEQFLMKTGKLDYNARLYRPERVFFIVILLLISAAINLFVFRAQIKDRFVGVDLVGLAADNYSTAESIDNRQMFNGIAWSMIKDNLILGVGVRNFVVRMDDYSGGDRLLPYFHQPVHNIYLLIAAEGGIATLALFFVSLFYIVRRALHEGGGGPMFNYTLFIIFFGFLFWGLFDHYFWTIQQGSLAFWMVAGLLANKK